MICAVDPFQVEPGAPSKAAGETNPRPEMERFNRKTIFTASTSGFARRYKAVLHRERAAAHPQSFGRRRTTKG